MTKSNFKKSYGVISVTSSPYVTDKRYHNNVTIFSNLGSPIKISGYASVNEQI